MTTLQQQRTAPKLHPKHWKNLPDISPELHASVNSRDREVEQINRGTDDRFI